MGIDRKEFLVSLTFGIAYLYYVNLKAFEGHILQQEQRRTDRTFFYHTAKRQAELKNNNLENKENLIQNNIEENKSKKNTNPQNL